MFYHCKGVIFDFNGTLFIDHDKHVLAWGKISELLRGRGITMEELQNNINGVPNQRTIQFMLGRPCDEAEITKYSELKEKYYRDFCRADQASFHLLAGSHQVFDALKAQGIPFTIASASIKPNIDFFVDSFDLANWFDPDKIIYDDGTYANKVKMFQHAAEVIGVPIEECLIFEDSASGIRNGYEAGCRNIVVIDSTDKADEYAKMPGVVRIVKDFEEFFDKQ